MQYGESSLNSYGCISDKKQKDYIERRNDEYQEDFECWRCNKLITVYKAEPKERVYCRDCIGEKYKEHSDIVNQYAQLKMIVMYENAMRSIEKNNTMYLNEYKKECENVLDECKSNTKIYKSSYEIIVAIILKANGYDFEANKKVIGYMIDFIIPELKICLEVDGFLHQHHLAEDSERDIIIRNKLGSSWEVIRIPTKYLDRNPEKIFEMIEQSKLLKQSLRSESGKIKTTYSNREKAHYDKIIQSK